MKSCSSCEQKPVVLLVAVMERMEPDGPAIHVVFFADDDTELFVCRQDELIHREQDHTVVGR